MLWSSCDLFTSPAWSSKHSFDQKNNDEQGSDKKTFGRRCKVNDVIGIAAQAQVARNSARHATQGMTFSPCKVHGQRSYR